MLSGLGLDTLGAQAAKVEEDQANAALVRSLIAALVTVLVSAAVLVVAGCWESPWWESPIRNAAPAPVRKTNPTKRIAEVAKREIVPQKT